MVGGAGEGVRERVRESVRDSVRESVQYGTVSEVFTSTVRAPVTENPVGFAAQQTKRS
jgi:hypothetical protein